MTVGILLCIVTGFSWVVVGAVVGLAEKRGYGSRAQQAWSTAFTTTLALGALGLGAALRPGAAAFSLRCDARSAVWTVLCGLLNYWMVLCMGKAMLRGPNGVVWTIVQSGFVFPFAMGVALGNTQLTAANAAGALCVLLGVFASGRATDAKRDAPAAGAAAGKTPALPGGGWLGPALLGFVLCGSNQCAICLASMGPAETRATPLLRVLLLAVGVIVGLVADIPVALLRARKDLRPSPSAIRPSKPRPPLGYLLRICLVYSATMFVSTQFCQLRAIDLLEAAGRISAANPAMLAATLVGFTLYGALALRERPARAQLVGTAFAIAGIVLLSI